MEYLFCCGKRPIRRGCGCSLKLATQVISFLGVIFSIPIMIGILNMNWRDYEEIPIIFVIYKGIGCIAPLLMFIGSIKMDFGLCYVGYIMHSIYIYGLIIFLLFIGMFWGILILPMLITGPPFILFFLTFYIFSMFYLGILLYFNDVYFSFTKYLGLGEVRICVHGEPANIFPQTNFSNQILIEP